MTYESSAFVSSGSVIVSATMTTVLVSACISAMVGLFIGTFLGEPIKFYILRKLHIRVSKSEDDMLMDRLMSSMGTLLLSGFLDQGKICGAVTSALMAIGIRSEDPLDTGAGETFMVNFEKQYGSLRCSNLRPEDKSHDACEGYITWAVEYLKKACKPTSEA